MNKFVVMADRGVGKTTLVNKLLKDKKENICGFFTSKYIELIDKEGTYPIYIRGINQDPILDEEHLIGTCGNGKHYTNIEVFNNLAIKYITTDNKKDLIIMDELGFLEMNAEVFKKKVLDILESNNPVLIMLKQRLDIDFLKQIKENKNIEFIQMDENNRNDIYQYLYEKLI